MDFFSQFSKGKWALFTILALAVLSWAACSSDSNETADDAADTGTTAANNSATAASVSLDACGSGIQLALEGLIDSEAALVVDGSKADAAGTESQDCPGGGSLTAEYDVTEDSESAGSGTATLTLTDCGGATGTLTATFSYSGYSDDGTNISVEEVTASLDGTLTVEVSDQEVSLTFDNDTATANLNVVIDEGSITSSTVAGAATATVGDFEATCTWDEPVAISNTTALAAGCEVL